MGYAIGQRQHQAESSSSNPQVPRSPPDTPCMVNYGPTSTQLEPLAFTTATELMEASCTLDPDHTTLSDHIHSNTSLHGQSAVDVDEHPTRDITSTSWSDHRHKNSTILPHNEFWQNDRSWVFFRSCPECTAISDNPQGYAAIAWEKSYVSTCCRNDSLGLWNEFV